MWHKRRLITISVAALILVSLCAVCATTSVTAKDSLGAPANGLDSGTAVCSWGAGRLDVFARGTEGNLWHKWFDGTWHSRDNLGSPPGGLGTTPTAVSWGAGRIDVFALGNIGGILWHKWFWQGWSGWESLGAPPGIQQLSAPTACSWGANRLDIFIAGTDVLWQKWWSNGWKDWVSLGSPGDVLGAGGVGAVSTVSWGYPRIDIFVLGYDGALWQKWFNGNWQPWHRFDDTAGLVAFGVADTAPPGTPSWGYYGFAPYAPAACSWGANRLDVFFVDMSGHLQQKWFDGNWHLNPVGGTKYITAAPSAASWSAGRIDIFARGDDFALWQLYFAGGWNGWYNLGLLHPLY